MDPEFAICFEGRLGYELEAQGVKVHRLAAVQVRKPLSLWRARRRLFELLANGSFDAVICHEAWPQALFGSTVKSAGVPLIFWQHLATEGRHWIERWAAFKVPSSAICPSNFVGSKVKNIYPSLCAEVIYYPIAPLTTTERADSRVALRAELGIDGESVVVIQACRMEPWKGQSQCLQALATLRDLPGWVCLQVGGPQRPSENDYFESLKKKAIQLGIGNRVHFLGQRQDVPKLLAAADIYCQPNTGLEGLPIVFGEALYAGLPIVSSMLGGFWELVDESCGILVPPNDLSSLSAALRRLIEDLELRRNLASNAPARAKNYFDPASQIVKLGSAVAKVLQAPVPTF
jgi:glycosyltransferase involved in cell wall biosynthesis